MPQHGLKSFRVWRHVVGINGWYTDYHIGHFSGMASITSDKPKDGSAALLGQL
jgi:hypothetical protein